MHNVVAFRRETPAPSYGDLPIEAALLDIGIFKDEAIPGIAAECRQVLAKFEFTQDEAARLVELAHAAFKTPPSPSTVDRWEQITVHWLMATQRDTVQTAVDAARALTRGDRRLRSVLEWTGLGSHLDAMKIFLDASQRCASK